MGKFSDWLFDNAYQADASKAEAEQRKKWPHLLDPNEKVLLAFEDRGGMGRDWNFFTTHRLLIKDGKGLGDKRKNYKSIPYWSIQAFSVDTAASSLIDGDASLRVYSKGIDKVELNFAAKKCNIFEIQQFLNAKVLAIDSESLPRGWQFEIDPTPPNMDQKQTAVGNMMDWLGDNATQSSSKQVEDYFKTKMPVLLKEEKVELAYKSGRDYTIFTNLRVMIVDVRGMMGKKVVFDSILWSSIQAFAVQTAGKWLDRDMEVYLFTNILKMQKLEQDLRNGKADLFALQQILCNHVLGDDTDPLDGLETHEGEVDDQKGWWWFRDNQRPLDTIEMNKVYHSTPPLLRATEKVEMAFKGHRDITLFTNLRVIIIDPKGLTGTRIEYFSLPWTSITAHSVRSSGKYFDWDSEVCFWTELEFYPGQPKGEDDPGEPPEPRQSFFEIDFNKDLVDTTALNYYLSRRLITSKAKMEKGAPIPVESLTVDFQKPSNFGFDYLLEKIGSDQREIDPKIVDQEFHTSTKILLDDEHVMMAFRAGRDISCFTNHRVLLIDVQGLSAQNKVQYTSIPFKSIRGWSVETAGLWDTDTELVLQTRNRWDLAEVKMDFRTGKADIAQINHFLSALIVGIPSDSEVKFGVHDVSSGKADSHPINGKSGILNNWWEIDAGKIDDKLRTDPLLLLKEERVIRAFQSGRDVAAYTNRRVIIIDTQGLTGKRVSYRSVPLREFYGYEFETNGHMDRDAEVWGHTNISQVMKEKYVRKVRGYECKQALLVKHIDIYTIGEFFNKHVLMSKNAYAYEPEVKL